MKKPISKLNICWIGDSNNVLDSLIAASVKFSFKLVLVVQKNLNQEKKLELGSKKIINKFLFTMTRKKQFLALT